MNKFVLILLAASLAGLMPPAWAADVPPPVTATVDWAHPGVALGTNFAGLSFETLLLLPDAQGRRYFRPDNQPLVNLFHTLGIRSLRIGGNTSDRDARQLPGPADWDSLFGFAQKAGVRVIYGLKLFHGDPQAAVQTVQYIMSHYGAQVEAFALGQEPSAYPVAARDNRPAAERMGPGAENFKYAAFAEQWRALAATLMAAQPDIQLCGPGVHNDPAWTTRFIHEFHSNPRLQLITAHLYPGGAGGKVPSPEWGREAMWSDRWLASYEKLYAGFAPLAAAQGLGYRLEEVNNFYNGGATNVSSTFTAALWGLDFMHWWAAHGAAGVNFHTGDNVAAGNLLVPSKYTAFVSAPGGYTVRPLGYGLAAFHLGSQGRNLPVTLSNPQNLPLRLYAEILPDHELMVTALNLDRRPAAPPLRVLLRAEAVHFTAASTVSLEAPARDLAAHTGQTLGQGTIGEDGTWSGFWTSVPATTWQSLPAGPFPLAIPPATAMLYRLHFTPEGPLPLK